MLLDNRVIIDRIPIAAVFSRAACADKVATICCCFASSSIHLAKQIVGVKYEGGTAGRWIWYKT